ncbi:hypothetical protein [Ferruginibacter sp.]|nr:hypothetical protein [Ferruginibacter sp.]
MNAFALVDSITNCGWNPIAKSPLAIYTGAVPSPAPANGGF